MIWKSNWSAVQILGTEIGRSYLKFTKKKHFDAKNFKLSIDMQHKYKVGSNWVENFYRGL